MLLPGPDARQSIGPQPSLQRWGFSALQILIRRLRLQFATDSRGAAETSNSLPNRLIQRSAMHLAETAKRDDHEESKNHQQDGGWLRCVGDTSRGRDSKVVEREAPGARVDVLQSKA